MTDDEAGGRRWLQENLNCSDQALEHLAGFAAALRCENKRQNLVAAASMDELWARHIVDSAQLLLVAREMRAADGTWLDLGTGAGFPGLIVALLDPTRPVLLVEERRRRIDWLTQMTATFGLGHVSIAGLSLSRAATLRAAVISARAFAPLPKLLHLAQRFSTPETIWLLPKGEKARQEVDELPGEVRAMFHVKQSVTSATAGIVVGRGSPRFKLRGERTC